MLNKTKILLITIIVIISLFMMIGGAISSDFQNPKNNQKQKIDKDPDQIDNTSSMNIPDYSNSCCTTNNKPKQNYQSSCCTIDVEEYSNKGGCC